MKVAPSSRSWGVLSKTRYKIGDKIYYYSWLNWTRNMVIVYLPVALETGSKMPPRKSYSSRRKGRF